MPPPAVGRGGGGGGRHVYTSCVRPLWLTSMADGTHLGVSVQPLPASKLISQEEISASLGL